MNWIKRNWIGIAFITYLAVLAIGDGLTAHAQKTSIIDNQGKMDHVTVTGVVPAATGPWIEEHCVAVLPADRGYAHPEQTLRLRCK